ncbi:HFL092Cp [Eremothecium sinecaudum]|uniref:HFL092Cp n=1 Tax=Eremothecium sinecaudum TaxID=45286 RepID=A0A0X8HUJ1_9SACH|nr:HFL092Cp [Eremothecium sinecaudum]AMD21764.1 HFL092Cp [Eremothecium sinecaudum]
MDTKYRYTIPRERRSWRDTLKQDEKLHKKTSSFDSDPIFTPKRSLDEIAVDGKLENMDTPSTGKMFGSPDTMRDSQVLLAKQPLISTEVLDIPNQRQLFFCIFAIIQSYKLYDLIMLKSGLPVSGLLPDGSKFNFISKYAILDSMFLYFLPCFKIPKLDFKPFVTVLQIALMIAFTVLLSNDTNIPVVSMLVSMWSKYHTKELSLTGASVNHRKVVDSSSHFKGAHTIKILPENTVMLNPFQSSYCLPLDDLIPNLHIPIRINSTSDISYLELEHRDLYTNELQVLNFTKKDLSKLNVKSEVDPNILYLQMPLKRIGFYQLKRIVDVNNFALRIYKPQLLISECPLATINGDGPLHKCAGDKDSVTIQVTGVPPMKLKYTKTVDKETYNFVDSSLQPEYFESPLLSNRKFFTKEDIADLKWAQNHPVEINLESFLKSDGSIRYSIDEVVDGLGNVMDFKKLPADLLAKYELEYKFQTHDLPRASVEEKVNPNAATKRSLVIKIESSSTSEDAPFVANFVYEYNGDKSTFQHEFEGSVSEILIDKPGVYTLASIQSKYCSGAIVGKSTLLITKPIPPQLTVKPTPILDQCIGQVGLNFDLTFTGVPPFYYVANIYKIENGKRQLYERKKYTSHGTRMQSSYSPTKEGHYEIVFESISNALFKEPIHLAPTSDFTFNTSMRVKANAAIAQMHDSKLCLGGSTKIPVTLTGEPPFNLNYDIVETYSNKRTSYKLEGLTSYQHEIVTPQFNVGDDYILSLISVKDSSGCLVPLSGNDARITVRRDVPTASFNFIDSSVNEQKMKEGTVSELPLRLSGEHPFTLRYKHISVDGRATLHETQFQSNYKPSLRVTKQGSYELLSVNDKSCKGKIEGSNIYKVSFFEKPTFSVVEHNKVTELSRNNFMKEAVCQGVEETVDLSLVGSAPFTVAYDLTSPNGQITSKSIQVATKYASLKLPNTQAGEYILTVKGVYDSYYTEQDFPSQAFKSSEVVIRQAVNVLPNIVFSNRGNNYRTCYANLDQPELLEPINLQAKSGKGPFTISFSIYHESTSKTDYLTVDGVIPERFDYKLLYKGLKLGNHIVTIEKLVDDNGCVYDTFLENNHIIISITDVPKIVLMEPSMEYCVGDYVSYQLNGVAPFTIKYVFNGVQLKSKEKTSQFVRFASEPGSISINSIQDSSSQCVVNFLSPGMESEYERLSLNIHPIPSVIVSQGENIIEDIHEGDLAEVIFTFEGTPPFSLTYVRTEEVEGRKGRPQIVETHKVSDIYSYEYRVATSLQGTYEAIEVSDAYCLAKNDAFFNHY